MTFLGGPVRIVADDLTGALDAAAPFARPGQPVGLVLHATEVPRRLALTISSESRDLAAADAELAATRACEALGGLGVQALWFHKVDSVLRGQPFAATAAMMRHLVMRSCVFAPAFPAMGRVTRGGQHLIRRGNDWCPAAKSDIAAGLRAVGLIPAAGLADLMSGGANALVVDAETQGDLDRAVARQMDPRLLWVGSRALAEALAGTVAPVPCPPVAIAVIGTAHPTTRVQVAFSAARLTPVAETGRIRPYLGQCILIDPVVDCANAALTRDAVYRAGLRIDREGLEGRSLFVTGGETLSTVLEAIGARSLDCMGEVGPGLPISTVRGGRLDGCSIVSKSGGFGTPDLLSRFC